MAILIIREGASPGTTYRLGQRNLTIGRDPGNLIQLVDDKVSRRHAMIRWDGREYTLIDLNSRNGVTIDGTKVHKYPLSVGDVFTVGQTVLEVLDDKNLAADAVLGRKVVSPDVVGDATGTMPKLPRLQAVESAYPVDIDALQANRESETDAWLARLRETVAAGQADEALDRALDGVLRFIDPDRCFIFRVTGHRRLVPSRAHVSPRIPRERRQAQPVREALTASVEEHRHVLVNDVPGGPERIGSALAVPCVEQPLGPVGVLYVDSYTETHQNYVAEDLTLLERVAATLAPALVVDPGLEQTEAE
jgi:hypothetical protein